MAVPWYVRAERRSRLSEQRGIHIRISMCLRNLSVLSDEMMTWFMLLLYVITLCLVSCVCICVTGGVLCCGLRTADCGRYVPLVCIRCMSVSCMFPAYTC